MADFFAWLALARDELTLFAACAFVIGGIDDIAVDLAWLVRGLWRRVVIYSRFARASAGTLVVRSRAPIAVFVPAWDESAVIGPMLRNAIKSWEGEDFRLYVGCYPNDPATIAKVEALQSANVRLVVTNAPGPTTKADCLNALWSAAIVDEATSGSRFGGIVLHDAEDVVHRDELRVFGALQSRFALIQLPVIPIADPRSRWVSGHYIDEFIESHVKDLVVREAIGASLPLAGVACFIGRDLMESLALAHNGAPFDAATLTEDYEIGVRAHRFGVRCALVRIADRDSKGIVAVRAHFPATMRTAVRQKSRWIAGIALSGWDRLGWQGGPAEIWMRWRDRRAIFAALALMAGYGALALWTVLWIAGDRSPPEESLTLLLWINSAILIWRAAFRMALVGWFSGWIEGLRAGPRIFVSNLIAIFASWRAVAVYIRQLRTGKIVWDKTDHVFPGGDTA